MRILFIGDIVGKNGREAVIRKLPALKKEQAVDFVIANGENITHGKGIIERHYRALIDSGVDAVTLGNHYQSKNEIRQYIDRAPALIRPLNLETPFPGVGSVLFSVKGQTIRVTNLLGQAFMEEKVNPPFEALSSLLDAGSKAAIHIVDFHAEATGEKQALAWAFDGRVSAVLGTHTHVQTRDARILPQGTAYISDVGMVGAFNGVLGVKKENVIARLWHATPTRFEIEDEDDTVFSAVLIDFDETTGKARGITPIYDVEQKH